MTGMALLLSFVTAFFIPGIIGAVKAKSCGRKAPSLIQPMFDIFRLLKKGSVYSNSTSFIFQITPVVYFVTIFLGLFFLPFGAEKGIFGFTSDFIFLAYLLAIGKFFMILGAIDTASPFEGMGANREAFYSMLIEPVFFAVMGSLALVAQPPSLSNLYANAGAISETPYISWMIIIFIIYILFNIALVENSRLPVDDPKTHLELTMVHEVMVLDNSGFDLGLIQAANALKFALYGGLIANFFLSPEFNLIANIAIFLGTGVLFATAIGLSESFRARNKMKKNALYIVLMFSLAVLLFFLILAMNSKFILT
jgi:formate hydrogenlyase subunit 4